MGYIYAYAPEEVDCGTIGLCGALLPTSAVFSLEAGAFPELTLDHPKDEHGKWKFLKPGVILKAPVPVRLCPDFDDNGGYVSTVEKWTVSNTASAKEREVYNASVNGKVISHIPRGNAVTVVQVSYSQNRTKVKASWTYKRKGKTYKASTCGWIATTSLSQKIKDVSVSPTVNGTESEAESYAIRYQLFRIYDASLTDSNAGSVTVKARHIVYDLLGNLCTYNAPTKKSEVSCKTVCEGILAYTIAPHNFTIHTDITDTRFGFDARDKNPIEALCDEDDGVLARWGAEIVVDDYDIYVLHKAGMDRGVRIEYAKNLTGITCDTDLSDVSVAIRPRGKTKSGGALYLDGTKSGSVWKYGDGSYTLPSGYAFYTDSNGVVHPSVMCRSTPTKEYPFPKILPLDVSDAAVSDDVDAKLARIRMVQAVKDAFENGADAESITLTVKFTMLGDTREYEQFRHLESLFVYDSVGVYHKPLGVSVPSIDLMSITWDCTKEVTTQATFGSLQDTTASVASWNISSVSGNKIQLGTVGASALEDWCISARHVQANAITATKIKGGEITGDKINAESVTSTLIQAESFSAKVAELAQASIQDASIGYAQIKDASVDTLFTKDGNADTYYIKKLGMTTAQALNLLVGMLVFQGSDGNYYRLDASIDASGNVSMSPTLYTGTVDASSGLTNDGRYVFKDVVDTDELYASNAHLADAIITRLQADKLFANEAFIKRLTTSQIFVDGGTLTMLSDRTVAAQQATLVVDNALTALRTTLYKYFVFDDERGLIVRGLTPTGANSPYYTVTSNDGFSVHSTMKVDPLGTFDTSGLTTFGVTVGSMKCRPTSGGGCAWVIVDN